LVVDKGLTPLREGQVPLQDTTPRKQTRAPVLPGTPRKAGEEIEPSANGHAVPGREPAVKILSIAMWKVNEVSGFLHRNPSSRGEALVSVRPRRIPTLVGQVGNLPVLLSTYGRLELAPHELGEVRGWSWMYSFW